MAAWLSRRGIAVFAGARGCDHTVQLVSMWSVYSWALLYLGLWASYKSDLIMCFCFRPAMSILQQPQLGTQMRASLVPSWALGECGNCLVEIQTCKPHCHLFLMSSQIIRCVLTFDIVWGGRRVGRNVLGGVTQAGCRRWTGASLRLHQCAREPGFRKFIFVACGR